MGYLLYLKMIHATLPKNPSTLERGKKYYIIAVDTYGAQRVTDPHTGKTISAQKLGYSSAVTAVLLTLYGEKAHDVSPK